MVFMNKRAGNNWMMTWYVRGMLTIADIVIVLRAGGREDQKRGKMRPFQARRVRIDPRWRRLIRKRMDTAKLLRLLTLDHDQ